MDVRNKYLSQKLTYGIKSYRIKNFRNKNRLDKEKTSEYRTAPAPNTFAGLAMAYINHCLVYLVSVNVFALDPHQ